MAFISGRRIKDRAERALEPAMASGLDFNGDGLAHFDLVHEGGVSVATAGAVTVRS